MCLCVDRLYNACPAYFVGAFGYRAHLYAPKLADR